MNLKKSRKLIGFLIFALGLGILLAICIPAVAWLVLCALGLIVIGICILRC